MPKLCTYKDHTLYGFKEEVGGELVIHFEVELPNGNFSHVDVEPGFKWTRALFYKWVDLGCPDRYDIGSREPLSHSDIEVKWDEARNDPVVF